MSSWYGDRLTLLAFAVASHVLLLSCCRGTNALESESRKLRLAIAPPAPGAEDMAYIDPGFCCAAVRLRRAI